MCCGPISMCAVTCPGSKLSISTPRCPGSTFAPAAFKSASVTSMGGNLLGAGRSAWADGDRLRGQPGEHRLGILRRVLVLPAVEDAAVQKPQRGRAARSAAGDALVERGLTACKPEVDPAGELPAAPAVERRKEARVRLAAARRAG